MTQLNEQKRWHRAAYLGFAVMYIALAGLNFAKFLRSSQSDISTDHAISAAIFAVTAIVFIYQFRHWNKPYITKLDITSKTN